ncbi:MAG: enoyl-[acyl-carrier-protein] reductase [Deltaproteobacteria bacterium]|nr:enoyl-[acyl-carrier-protein] reductase [Deltaproteobacteria bacterium]
MLAIDLAGKHALVAGVGDERGFGFFIAKALADAGATVSVATWPPLFKMFKLMLTRPQSAEFLTLRDGSKLELAAVYPYDAEYDRLEDVPADIREHRRYKDLGDFTTTGLAAAVAAAGGVDIVVHSLANGPEVQKPLLETSRPGYLAAISTSAYSHVSLVQHLGPHMRAGSSFVALSYLASTRVVPAYGGGMSAAKAALESDARVLAFEAGRRWGHRVNVISPGPYKSRAAEAIGPVDRMIRYAVHNAPLPEVLSPEEVGAAAAFLSSPLASGITGSVVYVDKGFHAMGVPVLE